MIHHFRHHDNSDGLCSHVETSQHLAMKTIISKMFESEGYITEPEVSVGPIKDKNIIDVLIKRGHRQIAIECQYSPISDYDVIFRTRSLNRKGYPVLWLLDSGSYSAVSGQRRVKAVEKFLHRINYGKVFYLSRFTKRIIAGKFGKVKRHVDFNDVSYTRTLKSTKNIKVFAVDRLLFTIQWVDDILGEGKFFIARLMV